MTERAAMLLAIQADPGDDTPRLAFADWLQENGEPERAEFIRVQCELAGPIECKGWGCRLCTSPTFVTPVYAVEECGCSRKKHKEALRRRERELWATAPGRVIQHPCQWFDIPGWAILADVGQTKVCWTTPDYGEVIGTVSRGFVSEIRLDSRTFLGGPCDFCSGRGHFQTSGSYAECPRCVGPLGVGTGRVPGLAADLFARHPITAVTFTDLNPWERVTYPGRAYSWTRADGTDPHVRPAGAVPAVLFERMWEDNPAARVWGEDPPDVMLEWTDPESPARALSAAAVGSGRATDDAIPTDSAAG